METYLSVLMTPCMNPYACQPATIFAFLLATSNTNCLPQDLPGSTSSFNTFSITHSPKILSPSKSGFCCPPPKKNMLVGPLNASKLPIRMKDGAIRVSTHAVSIRSRWTGSAGSEISDRARVVGILRASNASEHRYSRIDDLSTASPSALLEKGVRPAPLSWSSYTRLGSDGCGVTS